MPTYAYSCTACAHAFDAVQKFTDDALTACPECGDRLRKVYGSIGVSFKGSGFYRNDSRAASTGSGSGPKGEGKSEGKGDSTSETKTETKTEKKPEKKTETTSASSGSSGSSSSTPAAS